MSGLTWQHPGLLARADEVDEVINPRAQFTVAIKNGAD